MAFTKKQKSEMMDQYEQWLKSSQAVFLMKFTKMTMKDIDNLRAKARETGNELHVVKNTLFVKAMDRLDLPHSKLFEETTLVGFAFNDPPALAKVMLDSTKNSEIFVVKGGYLGPVVLRADQVKSLSELPPLPVMRAMLLGVISAPASKLVRTLAEPARSMASVIRAYSEKDAAPAAA